MHRAQMYSFDRKTEEIEGPWSTWALQAPRPSCRCSPGLQPLGLAPLKTVCFTASEGEQI